MTTKPISVIGMMMRKGGWWYVINLSIIVVILLIELLPGIITRDILNGLQDDTMISMPWLLLAGLFGITMARVVMFFVLSYAHIKARIPTENTLRRSLLTRILQMPAVRALKGSPGEVVSRFRDDINEMPHVIFQLNDIIALGIFSTVALVIMYQTAPDATLLILLPLILIVAGARFAYGRIYYYRQERRRASGRVVGFIGETYGAVQAVQVAGAERHVLKHFAELNKAREHATLREVLFDGLLDSMFRNATTLGTAIMMLMVHGQATSGEFGAGDVAFFVYSLGVIGELLGELGIFLGRQQQLRVSIQRLENIAHNQPMSALFGGNPAPALPALPPLHEFAVKDLTVTWSDGTLGIANIDFAVKPGMMVVVTGAVGAGKTTLLRAIMGMLPNTTGSITWNGQAIEQPGVQFVPPAVAYTSQVPRLFSDSLAENIVQGRSMVDTSMNDAIHGAVFEYDVAQFEHGVQTMVGARGVRLSGGQIQRAAFARMLYDRPQLWCIDDISSALDIETEQQLWQRFGQIRADVACVVVTHRPQVMQMADEVLVLDAGRVRSRGPYAELVANGAIEVTTSTHAR
jgi:ATP-binding cassette subfamily B protein